MIINQHKNIKRKQLGESYFHYIKLVDNEPVFDKILIYESRSMQTSKCSQNNVPISYGKCIYWLYSLCVLGLLVCVHKITLVSILWRCLEEYSMDRFKIEHLPTISFGSITSCPWMQLTHTEGNPPFTNSQLCATGTNCIIFSWKLFNHSSAINKSHQQGRRTIMANWT